MRDELATIEELRAQIARLSKLVADARDERDAWKGEAARATGLHRQALAERDAEIARLAERAERLEAAARDVSRLFGDDPKRYADSPWLGKIHALNALRAALGTDVPEGEGEDDGISGTPEGDFYWRLTHDAEFAMESGESVLDYIRRRKAEGTWPPAPGEESDGG